jgi:AraC-like DNA-binding protein
LHPTRLHEPSRAIATVTLEGGFEDFSTFNRRFRRASGLTASTFRAQ